MWKDTLDRKGIAIDALPDKVKRMVGEYNDIQSGIDDITAALASNNDPAAKREMEADLKELRAGLKKLDGELEKAISVIRVSEDGSVGSMGANDMLAAWNKRREQAKSGSGKTNSIF